jgi:hypothetical protein
VGALGHQWRMDGGIIVSEWAPAETARMDQLLASADLHLDIWVQRLREQVAADGEHQGRADVARALFPVLNRSPLDSMLLAALIRLAAAEPTESPGGTR